MTAEMWWELSLAWILRRHHLNLWLDGALEARGSGIHLLIFVIIRTPIEIDRALMFIWAAMLKTEKISQSGFILLPICSLRVAGQGRDM